MMANVEEQLEDALREDHEPQSDGEIERPMNGVLITKQKYDWCKERSTLGILSLKRDTEPVEGEVFVDKCFYSRDDEDAFISCCHLGPEFMKTIDKFLPHPKLPNSETHGEFYMSKVRQTWIPVAKYINTKSDSYTLTPQAIQALHDLGRAIESIPHKVEAHCFSFLERFGSHIFKGPIVLGGRLVQKVSCAGYQEGVSVDEVTKAIEETFETFAGEESPEFDQIIHLVKRDGNEDVLQLEKIMEGFPQPEPFSDIFEWKTTVAEKGVEHGVISYSIADENLLSVWAFVARNQTTFGALTTKLAHTLFDSWQKLSGFEKTAEVFLFGDDEDEEIYLPAEEGPLAPVVAESDSEEKGSLMLPESVTEGGQLDDDFQECLEDLQKITKHKDLTKVESMDLHETPKELDKEKDVILPIGKDIAEVDKSVEKRSELLQGAPVTSSAQDMKQPPSESKDAEREAQRSDIRDLLDKLGLSHDYPCKRTSQSVMAISPFFKGLDVDGEFSKSAIQDIMSLDFRGRKSLSVKKEDEKPTIVGKELNEDDVDDIFAVFQQSSDIEVGNKNALISSLDVMHSIYHCCNPFLRQDLFCKMAECQLAIPVVIPHFDLNRITFLLWGLRKIRKKWRSPQHNNEILEKTVASFPIPIVTFVRIGSPAISKTKLLNRLIGPHQGNNEHPYFVDREHDIGYPKWSKGTVEIVWYTPEGGDGSSEILKDAVTFLNLRGDALNFPKQRDFVSKFSNITVAVLGEDPSLKKEALKIAGNKNTLIVVVNTHITSGRTKKETLTRGKITIIDGSGQSNMDLCSEICNSVKATLVTRKEESETHSLEDIAKLCAEVGIKVDEDLQECVIARNRAHSVLASTYAKDDQEQTTPAEYKRNILPLQTMFWRKWAHLDKKSEKLIRGRGHKSMEHVRDDIASEKRTQRQKQVRQKVSHEINELIIALQSKEVNLRKFFMTWFQFRLNDMSRESLGPLIKELRSVQNDRRHLGSLIREMDESIKKKKVPTATLR